MALDDEYRDLLRADALDALEDLDGSAGARDPLPAGHLPGNPLRTDRLVPGVQFMRRPFAVTLTTAWQRRERCAWRRVSAHRRWLAQVPATGLRRTAEHLA